MRITVDIEDRIDHKLLIEAKKDGHENRSAIVRKATSFFLHHVSQKNAHKSDITLSPAVFDDLKKACPKRVRLNCHFADDIVCLGLLEYQKRQERANN